ncbi:hypothetical protein C8R47DRAFT_743816 [Mycena vitilis]|nr:hypothetical protein C8R47DRAFT_743816 [Mycena vitilis]
MSSGSSEEESAIFYVSINLVTSSSSPSSIMYSKKSRFCWDQLGGPRPLLPRFDPQLPRVLWERFRKDYPESIIFHALFSDARHQILTMRLNVVSLVDPADGEIAFDDLFPPVVTIKQPGVQPTKNGTMGGSWLHLAVTQGDLPLAHECIRLGTPIDHKDRRGYSALYFACSVVKDFLLPDGPVSVAIHPPSGRRPRQNFGTDFVSQLISIVLLLLEHHADPNEVHGGISLLGLACLADQWNIIQALLIHGAHVFPSSVALEPVQLPKSFLKTQRDRSVFDAFVTRFAGKLRPRRRCPCGADRALEDCHSKMQPYPEEGICPCGAGKICAKCCFKRKQMYWAEIWDARGARLLRLCIPRITQDQGVFTPAEEEYIKDANSGGKAVRLFTNFSRGILMELAEKGKLDPAYAAAGSKVHFIPLYPKGAQTMSKMEVNLSTGLWNAAVDEYIASGIDSRPTESIENAAKVGPAGGPLHRRCEAAGCPNIEYRNDVKLFLCSGCGKAVYCSRTCQKDAWKSHKSACRGGKARIQLLPSQEVYTRRMRISFEPLAFALGIDRDAPDFAVVKEMLGSVWTE